MPAPRSGRLCPRHGGKRSHRTPPTRRLKRRKEFRMKAAPKRIKALLFLGSMTLALSAFASGSSYVYDAFDDARTPPDYGYPACVYPYNVYDDAGIWWPHAHRFFDRHHDDGHSHSGHGGVGHGGGHRQWRAWSLTMAARADRRNGLWCRCATWPPARSTESSAGRVASALSTLAAADAIRDLQSWPGCASKALIEFCFLFWRDCESAPPLRGCGNRPALFLSWRP